MLADVPTQVVIIGLSVCLDDILIDCDDVDGTNALLVPKNVERIMQKMEAIGNPLTTRDLFDFVRWVVYTFRRWAKEQLS